MRPRFIEVTSVLTVTLSGLVKLETQVDLLKAAAVAFSLSALVTFLIKKISTIISKNVRLFRKLDSIITAETDQQTEDPLRNLNTSLMKAVLETFSLTRKGKSESKGETLFKAMEILNYALPKKVREQVYEPYTEELKEDFLTAPKEGFSGTLVRSFLWFRLGTAFIKALWGWIISPLTLRLGSLVALGKFLGFGGGD